MAVYTHSSHTSQVHSHARMGAVQLPSLSAALPVLALVSVAFNLRVAMGSVSPLLSTIGADLHFSTLTISLFGTVPPVVFAFTSMIAGSLTRKYALEQIIALSMAIAAIGMFGRAFSTNASVMIGLTAVTLIGAGIGGVVVPPLLKSHFPHQLAKAGTLHMVLMHAGAFVPPLMAVPLSDALGWRASIGLWSAGAVIASVIAALLYRTCGPQFPSQPRKKHRPQTQPMSGVMYSRTAWNLALLLGVASWNQFVVFTWLPPLLVSAGSSKGFSGLMVSLVIATSMVTAFVIPSLIARSGRTSTPIAMCFIALGLGYVGLAIAPSAAPVLWAILLGIGGGLFVVAYTLVNVRSSTPAGSMALSRFMQGWGMMIALVGPLLFGALYSLTGTWLTSIVVCGAISLLLMGWAGLRERKGVTIEEELAMHTARVTVQRPSC